MRTPNQVQTALPKDNLSDGWAARGGRLIDSCSPSRNELSQHRIVAIRTLVLGRIEESQVGEMVMARNEFEPNGPLELKRVVELFTRTSPIIELEIGGQKIGTTKEQPFYSSRSRGLCPRP